MINSNLHRQPVALDSAQHRDLKLRVPITDWTLANQLNAIFLAASEFGEACREFPIVFVRAGKDPAGQDQIAPVAVLSLTHSQNLFVSSGRWRANYIPVLLLAYPFCIARVNEQRFAVCVDMAWPGVNQQEGQALFDANGESTEMLKTMSKNLEAMESDAQRTRLFCQRLLELGVLREMRFDATLVDGKKHTVDGFLTVDDKKMTELSDAVVGELHRSGVLGLVHLHWASLGNMRRLVDWHVERAAGEAQPVPAA